MNPKFSKYYTYIKPVLKNKTVKTYSPLVFSLITIAIFSLYALRPTIATIISLQKSVVEQEEVLAKLNQKVKSLSDGRRNYQLIEEPVKDKLINLLPDSTSLPPLINDLTSIAVINSASISGVQFQPVDLDGPPNQPSTKSSLKEIELTANFQGNYAQLFKVLDHLSTANRLISIQSVNFSQPSDSPTVMQINAKAYYFKY